MNQLFAPLEPAGGQHDTLALDPDFFAFLEILDDDPTDRPVILREQFMHRSLQPQIAAVVLDFRDQDLDEPRRIHLPAGPRNVSLLYLVHELDTVVLQPVQAVFQGIYHQCL